MTDCSVYVGSLEDPKFKWDGGDWNNNCPKALSPTFPPLPQHYNGDFHNWVAATGVECKQTDYSGWVARVTKDQILQFIAGAYRGKESLPWIKDGLPELIKFVATLDDARMYALVANEW